MKTDIEQLAQEFAAVRKSSGRKFRYPQALKQQAAAAFRHSGEKHISRFAAALGISATALSACLASKGGASQTSMLPIKVIRRKSSLSSATGAVPVDGVIIQFRDLRIHLAAGSSPDLIARVAIALAEDSPC